MDTTPSSTVHTQEMWTLSAPLVVAAGASAGAGLVHAAAAGTHSGDDTLVTLFATVAVAQLALAAVAVASRTRSAVGLLGLANAAAVGAWALSRTRGLPWIDSLGSVEPVGRQDVFAALLGAAAAIAAALASAPWRRTTTAGPGAWLAVGASVGLALPGMTASHAHSAADQHDHAEATVALAGPAPGPASVLAAGTTHTHGSLEGAAVAAPGSTIADDGHDHPTESVTAAAAGPVISLDDPRVTDEQRRAAQQLIDRTTGAMARFTDEASLTAAGYLSIGDGVASTFEHFVNYPMLVDGRELDPGAIESVVMERLPDGTKRIASAMYILESGSTMADVPEIAGELTTWHDHQNLCWDPSGTRLAGVLVNGRCTPGGEFRPTAPMLHVWMVEHPCGPFAGIDGHGDCAAHGH